MAFAGIPSTYVHRSVGATLVKFNSVALGYAEDRIMIDERPVWEDIKNDAFGGAAGVPSDVQYLGSYVYVSCTLNRFVPSAIQHLSVLDVSDATLSDGDTPPEDVKLPVMGSFVRQTWEFAPLVLSNRTETITFAQAFLRQGRRFNVGVRHQQVMLMFECHINNPCDMVIASVSAASTPCS